MTQTQQTTTDQLMIPQLWQNTDFFPVGPAEYVVGTSLGLDELCRALAGHLGLIPYDVSYRLEYLKQPTSGLTRPRLELVCKDYPDWAGSRTQARIDFYPEGGNTPVTAIHVRCVREEEAFTIRFGEKCPQCAGRHRGRPCRYAVYVQGATLLSR